MHAISTAIRQLINISDKELQGFIEKMHVKNFGKNDFICRPGESADEIYFINKGLLRLLITNNAGDDITVHFALENQFLADYSAFILKEKTSYFIQAVEESEIVIIPRAAIEWGYKNLKEGEKMGRLIAEHYFIYQDNRVKDMYARSPKERYDNITEVFPNIHNRVPQHMIASYLGITSVHLSRLKKSGY